MGEFEAALKLLLLMPVIPALQAWAGYAMYGLSFLFFELTCFRLVRPFSFSFLHPDVLIDAGLQNFEISAAVSFF